jgi:hypothetical protein
MSVSQSMSMKLTYFLMSMLFVKVAAMYLPANWRIGGRYAGSYPFTIVNLVPESLISKKE